MTSFLTRSLTSAEAEFSDCVQDVWEEMVETVQKSLFVLAHRTRRLIRGGLQWSVGTNQIENKANWLGTPPLPSSQLNNGRAPFPGSVHLTELPGAFRPIEGPGASLPSTPKPPPAPVSTVPPACPPPALIRGGTVETGAGAGGFN